MHLAFTADEQQLQFGVHDADPWAPDVTVDSAAVRDLMALPDGSIRALYV